LLSGTGKAAIAPYQYQPGNNQITANSVTLSWWMTVDIYFSKYQVWGWDYDSGRWIWLIDIPNIYQTSTTVWSLSPATSYGFIIREVDTYGLDGYSNPIWITTSTSTATPTPTPTPTLVDTYLPPGATSAERKAGLIRAMDDYFDNGALTKPELLTVLDAYFA
jgi:hypothetical protein